MFFRLSRTFFKFFQTFSMCFAAFRKLSLVKQLGYSTISVFICQELFSFFSNFFQNRFFQPSSRTACICYHASTHLSSTLFDFFQKSLRASFEARRRFSLYTYYISRHHQSGHSHHHFGGIQRHNSRRYPHPGTQRSYAPADSSASPLLPGS